jgi:hypothetical protein
LNRLCRTKLLNQLQESNDVVSERQSGAFVIYVELNQIKLLIIPVLSICSVHPPLHPPLLALKGSCRAAFEQSFGLQRQQFRYSL